MTLRLEIAHKHSRERGFTLIASAICVVALFGAAGLAVDIGRMYITKNEAQSYADAAAVSAAMQLNGTANGLNKADAAVAASPNAWNFATTVFTGTVTEYSADGLTNWQTSAAATPATAAFARVTANISDVPLVLLPVLGAFSGNIGVLTTIKASAVAGQVLRALGAAIMPPKSRVPGPPSRCGDDERVAIAVELQQPRQPTVFDTCHQVQTPSARRRRPQRRVRPCLAK